MGLDACQENIYFLSKASYEEKTQASIPFM